MYQMKTEILHPVGICRVSITKLTCLPAKKKLIWGRENFLVSLQIKDLYG